MWWATDLSYSSVYFSSCLNHYLNIFAWNAQNWCFRTMVLTLLVLQARLMAWGWSIDWIRPCATPACRDHTLGSCASSADLDLGPAGQGWRRALEPNPGIRRLGRGGGGPWAQNHSAVIGLQRLCATLHATDLEHNYHSAAAQALQQADAI